MVMYVLVDAAGLSNDCTKDGFRRVEEIENEKKKGRTEETKDEIFRSKFVVRYGYNIYTI